MNLVEFLEPDFKFENDNGLLVQLIHDGMKQVNAIFSKANCVRGGHYHKFNKELFFVISGSFSLTVWVNDKREVYEFKSGDMFLINENVFHTFEYKEDTWLVSMYSEGVELQNNIKDIWTE